MAAHVQVIVNDQIVIDQIKPLTAATSPLRPSAARFSISFLISTSSTVSRSRVSGVRLARNLPSLALTTSEALVILRTSIGGVEPVATLTVQPETSIVIGTARRPSQTDQLHGPARRASPPVPPPFGNLPILQPPDWG